MRLVFFDAALAFTSAALVVALTLYGASGCDKVDRERGMPKVCLGGHQYYKGWEGHGRMLAIILTPDGRPVACEP